MLIETAGASLRYLPPYSPDFNPIENAVAKLKALLREAAERTVNGLWAAVGRLIDLSPPDECQTTSPQPDKMQIDGIPLQVDSLSLLGLLLHTMISGKRPKNADKPEVHRPYKPMRDTSNNAWFSTL